LYNLNDKVAIITGGALGIGGAAARKLASVGAKVFIADIDDSEAKKNVKRIEKSGGLATSSHVDVAEGKDISRMINEAVEHYGRLDILVQNAGGGVVSKAIHGSALDVDEKQWDLGINIYLKALYIGAKYSIPHLKSNGAGVIVNIASIHGILQEPGRFVYEAAKTGVIGMTRQLASEFGPDGIRVNAITPGHIVGERAAENWKKNPTGHKFFANQNLIGRTGTPKDIANGVVFLCSDDSSFITGHTLTIDGGITVQLQEKFAVKQAQYIIDNPDTNLSL
tara:strand:- start:1251 stop:2090 length:840 start_codon:yes stop_codon:yes gene_type:complete